MEPLQERDTTSEIDFPSYQILSCPVSWEGKWIMAAQQQMRRAESTSSAAATAEGGGMNGPSSPGKKRTRGGGGGLLAGGRGRAASWRLSPLLGGLLLTVALAATFVFLRQEVEVLTDLESPPSRRLNFRSASQQQQRGGGGRSSFLSSSAKSASERGPAKHQQQQQLEGGREQGGGSSKGDSSSREGGASIDDLNPFIDHPEGTDYGEVVNLAGGSGGAAGVAGGGDEDDDVQLTDGERRLDEVPDRLQDGGQVEEEEQPAGGGSGAGAGAGAGEAGTQGEEGVRRKARRKAGKGSGNNRGGATGAGAGGAGEGDEEEEGIVRDVTLVISAKHTLSQARAHLERVLAATPPVRILYILQGPMGAGLRAYLTGVRRTRPRQVELRDAGAFASGFSTRNASAGLISTKYALFMFNDVFPAHARWLHELYRSAEEAGQTAGGNGGGGGRSHGRSSGDGSGVGSSSGGGGGGGGVGGGGREYSVWAPYISELQQLRPHASLLQHTNIRGTLAAQPFNSSSSSTLSKTQSQAQAQAQAQRSQGERSSHAGSGSRASDGDGDSGSDSDDDDGSGGGAALPMHAGFSASLALDDFDNEGLLYADRRHDASLALTTDAAWLAPREQPAFLEDHCLLVRTELLREAVLFDARAAHTQQDLDLALTVRYWGRRTLFVPQSRVVYRHPAVHLAPADLPFFASQSCEEACGASLVHLRRKWGLVLGQQCRGFADTALRQVRWGETELPGDSGQQAQLVVATFSLMGFNRFSMRALPGWQAPPSANRPLASLTPVALKVHLLLQPFPLGFYFAPKAPARCRTRDNTGCPRVVPWMAAASDAPAMLEALSSLDAALRQVDVDDLESILSSGSLEDDAEGGATAAAAGAGAGSTSSREGGATGESKNSSTDGGASRAVWNIRSGGKSPPGGVVGGPQLWIGRAETHLPVKMNRVEDTWRAGALRSGHMFPVRRGLFKRGERRGGGGGGGVAGVKKKAPSLPVLARMYLPFALVELELVLPAEDGRGLERTRGLGCALAGMTLVVREKCLLPPTGAGARVGAGGGGGGEAAGEGEESGDGGRRRRQTGYVIEPGGASGRSGGGRRSCGSRQSARYYRAWMYVRQLDNEMLPDVMFSELHAALLRGEFPGVEGWLDGDLIRDWLSPCLKHTLQRLRIVKCIPGKPEACALSWHVGVRPDAWQIVHWSWRPQSERTAQVLLVQQNQATWQTPGGGGLEEAAGGHARR
eukprot:jgi/Mesen1/6640/ME000034S06093